MYLRNLKINEQDLPNKNAIIDGIRELDIIINDNYNNLSNEEVAMEFNIGSRLGEPKEYLVIYNNPAYTHNPYVFILKRDSDNSRYLAIETDLDTFECLADLLTRKEVNRAIAVNFERLPKHLFLGGQEILEARIFAHEYDELDR